MITSADIRQQFLEFFRSKGHEIVPSAPIVIKNDPTLMFTNAGMNQFKDYFLGNKRAPYSRVADTQKCLRVSGKHNDLEEVGVDTYHHTMFEMLGNWSFGDYFKKEAIAWSWELLTKVYRVPTDRLYITIFGGNEKEGLPKDEEAINEWKKWIEADRILPFGKKDNFWEMGDIGPCGPCTEIHVDCRPEEERKKIDGKTLVNGDNPQVIEIWNNVFIQFNRLKDGSLEALPARHVDTGMGLERLVRVLQNKRSNYDTDIFAGIIGTVADITGNKYGYSDSKKDIAFRVIADHIRAICFTIADGQLPSNTGAGYVIRRVLRRAVRYYYSHLDYKQPLLFQLVPVLARQFENVFPELQQQLDFIIKVVKEEEEAFLRTLEKGLKLLDNITAANTNTNTEGKSIAELKGSIAFELYDTYGFPFDLTQLIAAEKGFVVDEKGFKEAMQQQKDRSRAATSIDTEDWVDVHNVSKTSFVGYNDLETNTQIVKYRKIKIKGKEQYQVVLETTPFYAESGGQVGDTGTLSSNGETIEVIDTKKENDLIVHFVNKLPSDPEAIITASVNRGRRSPTAGHHTATHLLHAALRQVLGNHVAQKGSLVSPDILRFDFSHFTKMTEQELAKVEALVNEKIRSNIPVVIKEMPKDEALKLGAMALFGEKYGEKVRVVIVDPGYSIELCGGTHVKTTGELGFFKIIAESAVGAGVRRIEALCGKQAEDYINAELRSFNYIKGKLKANKDIEKSFDKFFDEKIAAEKKITAIENAESQKIIDEFLKNNIYPFKGIKVVSGNFQAISGEVFNSVFSSLRAKISDSLLIIGATIQDVDTFRFFINTKNSVYKSKINLKNLNDSYFSKLIRENTVVQGGDIILNAWGKFNKPIPTIVNEVRELTFDTIHKIENSNTL